MENEKVEKTESVKAKGYHSNIFEALSAFQGELKTMPKTMHVEFEKKAGGTVKFNYTPLGEIMGAIYPLLAHHGLSVRHEIIRGGTLGAKEGIEAIVTHETYSREKIITHSVENDKVNEVIHYKVEGELRSGLVYINQSANMKDIGGEITYAKRYTLTQLLGIASEDDLDAKLFENRVRVAMGFVFSKAQQGIQNSKTSEEIDKQINLLKSDLKSIESKKAGALGLTKEQCEELLKGAQQKKEELSPKQDEILS